ncbi:ThuA domain-containing protein [Albibacterium sp.]|uniref:ThuA domain-containing protein n=1 Tax=Albibacterium sp. TaxID=2952885 RepID=UPI002C99E558|nr:ThuA domain-containing protein [Albibacterium sp.]HUH18228.1 ThuA domain-containing protein [Albibacterium sp.]
MSFIKIRLFIISLLSSTVILFSSCSGLKNSNVKTKASNDILVLLVGGGSSHDFDKWYKQVDVQTLMNASNIKMDYVDDVSQILHYLPNIDVLFLTNNQPISDAATREAILSFVDSGKGLVLGHAALWYNWEDWPEYNKLLVSGGSRGHDAYGGFDVKVLEKNHPVTEGVPESFHLKDELYYFKEDSAGPGIEVLATANRAGSTEVFPSVFVVKNPNARIVGIALGHDAESHELKAYQSLLINAIKWVARK